MLSDRVAAKRGMVRIVDEEGEDYLYMADMFYPLTLPKDVAGYLHEREPQFG